MTDEPPYCDRRVELFLVEPYSIYRAAMRLLLEEDGRFDVNADFATCDEVGIENGDQPLVLVSTDLESGAPEVDAVARLAARARILVLCAHPVAETQLRAVRLGATGIVGKDQPPSVLLKAIEKVSAGEAWFDRSTIAAVISGLGPTDGPPEPAGSATVGRLTRREREVIALVARGLKNREIAERLFISDATVRHHLTSIFNKLEVSDRLELLVFAYRHGLSVPDP